MSTAHALAFGILLTIAVQALVPATAPAGSLSPYEFSTQKFTPKLSPGVETSAQLAWH